VFALTAALIGRLGAIPLAAHQIALNTVALTYMVPLGISSAAAVRVGQAIGRKDPTAAANAGDTAIFVGALFMGLCSVALLIFPRPIARMYTPDEAVIHTTIILLAAGAAFQLFDGLQTVAHAAHCAAQETPVQPCSVTSPPIGLLDAARRLALLPPRMGRFRPLGRPKPRANIDRNRPTIRLAPHRPKLARPSQTRLPIDSPVGSL